MWRDLACAAALLAVAVGYYALASELRPSALSDQVGPGGMPLVYAALLAALAAALGLKALLQAWLARAEPARPTPPPLGLTLRRAAGALSIGVAYVVLVPLIGYPFAIASAIAAMALYQGERATPRLALIACGGGAALYVLFDRLLGIAMPVPWSL